MFLLDETFPVLLSHNNCCPLSTNLAFCFSMARMSHYLAHTSVLCACPVSITLHPTHSNISSMQAEPLSGLFPAVSLMPRMMPSDSRRSVNMQITLQK